MALEVGVGALQIKSPPQVCFYVSITTLCYRDAHAGNISDLSLIAALSHPSLVYEVDIFHLFPISVKLATLAWYWR